MNGWQGLRLLGIVLSIGLIAVPAGAINVVVNYTYDTTNFFGGGNPQGASAGAQARATLESAASYFSSILNDTFSAITVPAPIHSPSNNSVYTWIWDQRFPHPATGAQIMVPNPSVAADQYVIYAGARSLPGITAGIGAVGGYGYSADYTGPGDFTPTQGSTIELNTANFVNAIEQRGEPNGFGNWGGVVSFDSNPGASWHFNHTTQPSGNVIDFYSVAVHELAHALGFGQSNLGGPSAWASLVSGSFFEGGNSKIQNGGNPVPLAADGAHWANGTTSVVYGGSMAQEAAMDPDSQNGTRKLLTALDAAALKDIGWEVVAPPPPPGIDGDYNDNAIVDAADYVVWRERLNQSVTIPNDTTPGTVTAADFNVWRSNFGRLPGSGSALAPSVVPEPGIALPVFFGMSALGFARRKRRR